jgi:hypothetical protein
MAAFLARLEAEAGKVGVVERKVKKKMGMKIQPKQPVCRDNT